MRCWKINPAEAHTCTPYYHYKGVTWTATLPNWETFDFIIDSVEKDSLIFKITSWKEKDKYFFLYFDEIDDNLKFNLEINK